MLLENGLPGDRFNDSGDIVADETELGAPSRLLHGPPQRRLGVLRHRVRLVQDDDLVGRTSNTWKKNC